MRLACGEHDDNNNNRDSDLVLEASGDEVGAQGRGRLLGGGQGPRPHCMRWI